MMKPWMRLLAQDAQTFFITIAVLLGTGILGLPVKLVYSGMAPFVVVFTITLLMQLAIIWVSCDLVSIAKQSLPRSDLHTIGRRYLSPVQSICFDLLVLLTFISTLISYALAGSKAFVSLNQIIHPGAGDNSQAIITPFVLACACGVIFLEALLKPAIAAGTAAKVILLIGIVAIVGVVASHVDLSPTTSWNDIMQPYLVGTVAIGGIGNLLPAFFDAYLLTPPVKALEAAEVANNAGTNTDATKKSTDPNDPANLPKSFYMKAMKHFRSATAAGVIACYALNIAWAAAVTKIVPQTMADAQALRFPTTQSLEYAANNGEPATVPVVDIINSRYPQFTWVATTVSVFIALSIVVSFNAVGLGTKHVLDGMAVSGFRAFGKKLGISAQAIHDAVITWGGASHAGNHATQHKATQPISDYGVVAVPTPTAEHAHPHHSHSNVPEATGIRGAFQRSWHSFKRAMYQLKTNKAARGMVASRAAFYIIVFGLVLLIALSNPQGFITVLEVFTSLALNSSGGIFIAVIYFTAVLPKGLGGCGAPEITQASVDAKKAERKEARRASQEAAALAADVDAATAAADRARADSEDSDDFDDEEKLLTLPPLDQVPLRPRTLGLSLFWGRLLSGFSLITFLIAVFYDAYSAVEDQATVVAGIFTLLIAFFCFWSFAIRPYIASLLWFDICKPELREREIDGVLAIDGIYHSSERAVPAGEGGHGTHAGPVAIGIARRASIDVTTPLTGGAAGRRSSQTGGVKRTSIVASAGAGEGIMTVGSTLGADAAAGQHTAALGRHTTAGISMKEVVHRIASTHETNADAAEGAEGTSSESAGNYGSTLGLSGATAASPASGSAVSPAGVVIVAHSGGEKVGSPHPHYTQQQGAPSVKATPAPAVVINAMGGGAAAGSATTTINSIPPHPPRKFLSFVWSVISTRNPAEQVIPILGCVGIILLHLEGSISSKGIDATSVLGGVLLAVNHFLLTSAYGGFVPGSYSRKSDESGLFSPNTKRKMKTYSEAPGSVVAFSRFIDAVGLVLIMAAAIISADSNGASSAQGGVGLPIGVAIVMLLLALFRVVMAAASSGRCGR